MGTRALVLVVAMLAAAAAVAAPGPPAGASVALEVAGNRLNVAITGAAEVTPECRAGVVALVGVAPASTLDCTQIEELFVTADGGAQVVDARPLDAIDVFPQSPRLLASLGAERDVVFGSTSVDILRTGDGDDEVTTGLGGLADTDVDLGPGDDVFRVVGTPDGDAIAVRADGDAILVAGGFEGSADSVATSVHTLVVDGGGGGDLIATVEDGAPATLVAEQLLGGAGDDDIDAGPWDSTLAGGSGRNDLADTTADDLDTFLSSSNSDTLRLGPGRKRVVDLTSLRTGGRVLESPGGPVTYRHAANGGDHVVRSRPPAGGGEGLVLTSSLDRPGRQVLGGLTESLEVSLANGETNSRGLVDVVAIAGMSEISSLEGDGSADDLLDVTVPTGAWGVVPDGAGQRIQFQDSGLRPIRFSSFGAVSVHGPWTDAGKGFVHRATRDLLFRFASTQTVDSVGTQISLQTLTRPAFVASLMDTDEYRGIEVDRAFVDFLRRRPDAAGRAYWIDSIDGGNPLWRVRAQLFGSPEYFAKAGGTNAAFVQKAYSDVLGRSPDAAGLAYWVQRLATGTTRGTVALQFLNSSEARRALVDDQFLRFLDRTPTSEEQALWAGRLTGRTGEQDLVAFLAASTAYFQRT